MYKYILARGEPDTTEITFAADQPVDWHAVVRAAVGQMEDDFELDELIDRIEQGNPGLHSLAVGPGQHCCHIDIFPLAD